MSNSGHGHADMLQLRVVCTYITSSIKAFLSFFMLIYDDIYEPGNVEGCFNSPLFK